MKSMYTVEKRIFSGAFDLNSNYVVAEFTKCAGSFADVFHYAVNKESVMYKYLVKSVKLFDEVLLRVKKHGYWS